MTTFGIIIAATSGIFIILLVSIIVGLARGKSKEGKKKFKPHYRRGKKGYNKGHPLFVHKKKDSQYDCLSLTHKDKTFGKDNIPLEKNPNPKDKEKSYVLPKTFIATDKAFQGETLDWKNIPKKELKRIRKQTKRTDSKPNDFQKRK